MLILTGRLSFSGLDANDSTASSSLSETLIGWRWLVFDADLAGSPLLRGGFLEALASDARYLRSSGDRRL